MAATKYSYAIADDFPDGKMNPGRFAEETRASAILTALDYVATNGGSESQGVVTGGACDVWFKAALSSGDRTIFDGDTSDPAGGLIAAHDNSPNVPQDETKILNPDGVTVVNWPMTSGGADYESKTPIFLSNKLPAGYQFYGPGCADDPTVPSIGGGELFVMSRTDQGAATPVTWQFLDHVYLLGGRASWNGADIGDWVRCSMFAPASQYSDTGGEGKYGVTLYDLGTGGPYMLIPNPSSPTHYVDPVKYAGTEVEQYLVPVPAFSEEDPTNGNGWWDWDSTQTPAVTPNYGQTGCYNLFSAQLNLWMHVSKIPILDHGNAVICPEDMKGKKILPTWKFRAELHRETSGTVKATFYLYTARKRAIINPFAALP